MPPTRYDPTFFEQTTASQEGGCLSGFIVPPLAVIFIGAFLAFFLLGTTPASPSSALAAAPVQDNSSAPPASTDHPSGNISPIFGPQIQYWGEKIAKWSASAGVDPNLAATVMLLESCGNPRALSSAGAMGLFQVMPYHFASGDDPYNPDTNALRGLAYLKRSLTAANGNPLLALAGYNGGISVINKPQSSWAGQTQRYADWGNKIYAEVSSGGSESPNYQEWYTTKGAGMCNQASMRLGINP
jgi:soluble lytic murein transglycosylase-like protein